MRKPVIAGLIVVIVAFCPSLGFAGDGFLQNWFGRVDRAKDEQPHWLTPIATTTPRLEEEFRFDQVWQNTSAGTTTNFGGGKGLELIPSSRIEVILNLPPYFSHEDPAMKDGWGDVAFLVKYRVLSADEKHGNYILTAFLGWSLPTGQSKNGSTHALITPTLAYGKGWRAFDVQGTFGVAFPVADSDTVGRLYLWNNTAQYHVFHKLWPEVELNSTFFQLGPHDGMRQTFVTPGLVIGRLPLWRRVGLTFGGGFQIAATSFHTSNHNAIFSIRLPF